MGLTPVGEVLRNKAAKFQEEHGNNPLFPFKLEVDVRGNVNSYGGAVTELFDRCLSALLWAVGKPNDSFMRMKVRLMVDRGVPVDIGRMLVVCDETNNDPTLVDRNGLCIAVFMDSWCGLDLLPLPTNQSMFRVTVLPA